MQELPIQAIDLICGIDDKPAKGAAKYFTGCTVMEFSDDQFAIIGSFAAIAVCGIIAAFTFHFGPAGKGSQTDQSARSLSFPPVSQDTTPSQDRKAA